MPKPPTKPLDIRAGFNRPQAEIRPIIARIEKRVAELQALDPTKLTDRSDPTFKSAENMANNTLAELFGRDSPEYNDYVAMLDTAPFAMGDQVSRDRWVRGYQQGIAQSIGHLKTVKQLFEERLEAAPPTEAPAPREPTRNVFIVHGHDEAALHQTARFVTQMELNPIVLREQPNEGRTIIEKLEKHTPDAQFAIVLLTPDDVGHPAGKSESAKPRARQNVVLELGIFLGSLGRRNVVALLKGDVEIPSDFHGVIYVPMDAVGAWKLAVAREIKAAGIDVDLNRAF